MSEKRRKLGWLPAGRELSAAGRRDGGNGRHASSGPLAWYFAQREDPAPKYALTISGYIAL